MNLLSIALQVANYEQWGVKSILIGAIIAMATVIAYLYKSKEEAMGKKDAEIMRVIKEHQSDLKEYTGDVKLLADKYHQFTESIKDLVKNGRI